MVDDGRSFAEQADDDLNAVADDPVARLAFATHFFDDPDDATVKAYGVSELAFMQWEIDRGCLNPLDDPSKPGSPWWRAVNGNLLRDAREAELLHAAKVPSSERRASNPSVQRWHEFLEQPSARRFYLAHNRSIAVGYVLAAPLAGQERGHEQKLMNIVLYRVLFTQAVVDDQHWALGWLDHVLGRWVSPKSTMVRRVVHARDLYPSTYPLSKADCERLDRPVNRFGDLLVSLVDLVVISYRLPRLYAYAAGVLELPELARMTRHYMPCYPWGLRMHENELDAIEGTDKPSLMVRLMGRLVHGATA